MKRFILIVIVMLGMYTTQAQEVTKDSTQTITTAERIIDKYSDKVTVAITSIAESLKVPAEHVYTVLVKKHLIEGITDLIIILFLFIMAIIAYNFGKAAYRIEEEKEYNSNEEKYIPWYIVTGILTFIAVILMACNLGEALNNIFNPEYEAIQDIIKMIK